MITKEKAEEIWPLLTDAHFIMLRIKMEMFLKEKTELDFVNEILMMIEELKETMEWHVVSDGSKS